MPLKLRKKGNPNLAGGDGNSSKKIIDSRESENNSKLYAMQKSVEAKEAKVAQLENELKEIKERLETASLSMSNPECSIEDVKSLGEHKFALSSRVRGIEAQLERAKLDYNIEAQEVARLERRCYDLRCYYSSAVNGNEHLAFITAINAEKSKIAELEMNITNLRKKEEEKQTARANEFKSWTGRDIASEPVPNDDVPEMTETTIPRGVGRSRFGTAAHADASWQPAR